MLVQLQRRIVEFAIRTAIGATRSRVLAVVMGETLLNAGLGALAGAALATAPRRSALLSSMPL